MTFTDLLKEGYTVSIHGNKEYTGAHFFNENGMIFVQNRHIGKSDVFLDGLDEHFENMIKEGFTVSIGLTFEQFKSVEGGHNN